MIDKKDSRNHLLDPLSTIIKLIIISYKKVNCKLSIWQNTIDIQEPNIFQPAFRYLQGDNKTDLHILSYPIESACQYFLSVDKICEIENIEVLFQQARNGIGKLAETYSDHSLIIHCLNFYDYVIEYHLKAIQEKCTETVTVPRILSEGLQPVMKYDTEVINNLNSRWSSDKLKIVVELVKFIGNQNGEYNDDYLRCLEKLMIPMDKDSQIIILTYYK